jgi:CheY-like chemotaxis protein
MELRKDRPTLPIIALSGGGRFGDTDLTGKMDFLEVAERVGASAKLRKPVDFEELAETINRLLQNEEPAN